MKTSDTENTEIISPNPFLNARRHMNSVNAGLRNQNEFLRIITLGGCMVTLVAIFGNVYTANQSKFIPFIVEKDTLGRIQVVKQADISGSASSQVVGQTLEDFVYDLRTVSSDKEVQNHFIWKVYGRMRKNDPALNKYVADYGLDGANFPYKRAEKETVSVEITSSQPESNTSSAWWIEWKEITYDLRGNQQGLPTHYRAMISVIIVPPTNTTTQEEFKANPYGIFVRDFTVSKI